MFIRSSMFLLLPCEVRHLVLAVSVVWTLLKSISYLLGVMRVPLHLSMWTCRNVSSVVLLCPRSVWAPSVCSATLGLSIVAVHTMWQRLPMIRLSRLPPSEWTIVVWPLSVRLQKCLSTQCLCPSTTVITCVLVATLFALFLNRVHGPIVFLVLVLLHLMLVVFTLLVLASVSLALVSLALVSLALATLLLTTLTLVLGRVALPARLSTLASSYDAA